MAEVWVFESCKQKIWQKYLRIYFDAIVIMWHFESILNVFRINMWRRWQYLDICPISEKNIIWVWIRYVKIEIFQKLGQLREIVTQN